MKTFNRYTYSIRDAIIQIVYKIRYSFDNDERAYQLYEDLYNKKYRAR